MHDTENQQTLAERMAAVSAAARGGEEPAPPNPAPPQFRSSAELIEEIKADCVAPPMQQSPPEIVIEPKPEPAPAMQPGHGTTFTPTPAEPVAETVQHVEPPEPIRVEVPPEPEQAEEPQAKPEVMEPRSSEPYAAGTMGEVIDMLERGGFSHDALQAFQALARGMQEVAAVTGKSQKGTLTIKLSLKTEGEAFFVEADHTVKAPKLSRPKTIAWTTDDGRISPSQPKQQLLFGAPGTEHGERTVRTLSEARVVHSV